ncbi:hypothetical protein SAMN05216552_101030 [Pseudoduganella namucuonensis]|uniref:Uncharacterized protein n=1 Tax=Pseudoduganella namucuonensis TaxID=1035707 RepID=A0A1I7J3I1_9BURK|nr:hypothetical protein SAMN05216552_101030 [Pseudoduganella namucuonensis]
MLRLSPRQVRGLATRLAREYGFQPSEIDRMTLDDMLWWLDDQAKEGGA